MGISNKWLALKHWSFFVCRFTFLVIPFLPPIISYLLYFFSLLSHLYECLERTSVFGRKNYRKEVLIEPNLLRYELNKTSYCCIKLFFGFSVIKYLLVQIKFGWSLASVDQFQMKCQILAWAEQDSDRWKAFVNHINLLKRKTSPYILKINNLWLSKIATQW